MNAAIRSGHGTHALNAFSLSRGSPMAWRIWNSSADVRSSCTASIPCSGDKALGQLGGRGVLSVVEERLRLRKRFPRGHARRAEREQAEQ